MDQKLARPFWRVVEAVGGFILADVAIDQKKFAGIFGDVSFVDGCFAVAQRLNFAAKQHDSCFQLFFDCVIKMGFAVGNHLDLLGFLTKKLQLNERRKLTCK